MSGDMQNNMDFPDYRDYQDYGIYPEYCFEVPESFQPLACHQLPAALELPATLQLPASPQQLHGQRSYLPHSPHIPQLQQNILVPLPRHVGYTSFGREDPTMPIMPEYPAASSQPANSFECDNLDIDNVVWPSPPLPLQNTLPEAQSDTQASVFTSGEPTSSTTKSNGHKRKASSHSFSSSGSSQASPKRRDVGRNSCESCRKSHVKCDSTDRSTPCGKCVKKNRPCVYGTDDRTVKDNLDRLDSQIAHFEDLTLQWNALGELLVRDAPADTPLAFCQKQALQTLRRQSPSVVYESFLAIKATSTLMERRDRVVQPKFVQLALIERHSLTQLSAIRKAGDTFVQRAKEHLTKLYGALTVVIDHPPVRAEAKRVAHDPARSVRGAWMDNEDVKAQIPELSWKQKNIIDAIVSDLLKGSRPEVVLSVAHADQEEHFIVPQPQQQQQQQEAQLEEWDEDFLLAEMEAQRSIWDPSFPENETHIVV